MYNNYDEETLDYLDDFELGIVYDVNHKCDVEPKEEEKAKEEENENDEEYEEIVERDYDEELANLYDDLDDYFHITDHDFSNARHAGTWPMPDIAIIDSTMIAEVNEIMAMSREMDGEPICQFFTKEYGKVMPWGFLDKKDLKKQYKKLIKTGTMLSLICDSDPDSAYFIDVDYRVGIREVDRRQNEFECCLTEELQKGRQRLLSVLCPGEEDKYEGVFMEEDLDKLAYQKVKEGIITIENGAFMLP